MQRIIKLSKVMEERYVKEEAKRIPYGMMNFVAVREDNCYYVDKTRFIEKVALMTSITAMMKVAQL